MSIHTVLHLFFLFMTEQYCKGTVCLWLLFTPDWKQTQEMVKSRLILRANSTWKLESRCCQYVDLCLMLRKGVQRLERANQTSTCCFGSTGSPAEQTHPRAIVFCWLGPRLRLQGLVWLCPEGVQMNRLVGKITPKVLVLLPSRAPISLASKRALWVLHLTSPFFAADLHFLLAPQGSFLEASISFRILMESSLIYIKNIHTLDRASHYSFVLFLAGTRVSKVPPCLFSCCHLCRGLTVYWLKQWTEGASTFRHAEKSQLQKNICKMQGLPVASAPTSL